MVIEPLEAYHDRTSFDCGKPKMNEFFQKTARQHADKDVGVTHVVVEEDGAAHVMGFVTLSMKPVSRESLPAKGLPRGDYVVGFIGQIATDKGCQRRGIGERLLFFALYNAQRVSETFGLIGVALDLLVDEGEGPVETARRRKFYLDRGFIPLAEDGNRLYISMKDVRRLGISERFGKM